MDLLTIIVALVVVGLVLFAINKWIPMDGKIKTILNWTVVIIVCVWLLKISGILDNLRKIHI